MSSRAFTLIEVMAVIVLMGLVAAGVSWSLAGPAQQSRHEDALGIIGHADATARSAARGFGRPCVLRIDLDRGVLHRGLVDDSERDHAVTLPDGHRVERVRVVSHGVSADEESGAVAIRYDAAGRSATFALCVTSPANRSWLLFAGLTGQATRIEHDEQIDSILALVAPPRTDAD